METHQSIYHHVLPEESGGDTSWFFSQNEFEQQEVLRQVKFKRKYWPDLEDGRLANHPAHTYPHILPMKEPKQLVEKSLAKAFYSPHADDILAYFKRNNIALHTEVFNLKSSQVACLNFLFPLRQDQFLATEVFKDLVPNLYEVTGIEFEYTGPIEATHWLGEPPSGKRGQNRTSIDAVLSWVDKQDRPCATLIEWKYTERNYGECSAYHSGNVETKLKCRSLDVIFDQNPASSCRLTGGTLHCQRRYWEHTASAGIDLSKFEGLKGCPFRGPFYQIWRQHLLAAYLRSSMLFDYVDVVSVSFKQNTALNKIHRQYFSDMAIAKEDVLTIWNRALSGVPPIRHIHVERLMSAVDQASQVDPDWREYILERYGV